MAAATTKRKKKAKKAPTKRPSARSTKPRTQPKRAAPVPMPVLKSPQPLATTTFRLPMDLLGELRVAATVRRNRSEKPYTQGGIVEAALRAWLASQK